MRGENGRREGMKIERKWKERGRGKEGGGEKEGGKNGEKHEEERYCEGNFLVFGEWRP